jgi:hypothetical protein
VHKERMAKTLTALILGIALMFGGMAGRAAAGTGELERIWYDANYGSGGHYYRSKGGRRIV